MLLPTTGVFLQVKCEDAMDLTIPGHTYTFVTVKEAQARSDLDALAARHRRAPCVRLGSDVSGGLQMLNDALDQVLA